MIRIDGNEWTTDDLETLDDCDAAEEFLSVAILKIETQLKTPGGEPDWRFNANMALKLKKLALQKVSRRRGEINRAKTDFNTRFVNSVRDRFPETYDAIVRQL